MKKKQEFIEYIYEEYFYLEGKYQIILKDMIENFLNYKHGDILHLLQSIYEKEFFLMLVKTIEYIKQNKYQ